MGRIQSCSTGLRPKDCILLLQWGQDTLSIALKDIQVGLVSELDDDYNYDPTYLRPEYGPLEPPGFEWISPTFSSIQEEHPYLSTSTSWENKVASYFWSMRQITSKPHPARRLTHRIPESGS